MSKEKIIDAKKIKLTFNDIERPIEELAVLAIEENLSALAILIEKKKIAQEVASRPGYANTTEASNDLEIIQKTEKILKERMGDRAYNQHIYKATELNKKLSRKNSKHIFTDYSGIKEIQNALIEVEKDVNSYTKQLGKTGTALVKEGKKICRISLKFQSDYKELKPLVGKLSAIRNLFSEDDGASI